jgi:hypothetical protein
MFRVKGLQSIGLSRRAVRGMSVTAALMAAIALTAPAGSVSLGEVGEVGTTVVTVQKVTGFLGQEERALSEGARVHLNEILETGAASHAELELDDDTKLALGPNGRLTLDEYAVGGAEESPGIALTVLKGAFRFVTGESDKDAYRIDTPSATIGVLGTVVDLFAIDEDEVLVLLLEGQIEVCSRTAPGSLAGGCRSLGEPNHIIYACQNGFLSEPFKWSDALLPGVPVSTVFPFLQDAPQVDPVKRAEYADISDDSPATLNMINDLRARCRT